MNYFIGLWSLDQLSLSVIALIGGVAVVTLLTAYNVLKHETNVGTIAPAKHKRAIALLSSMIVGGAATGLADNLIVLWAGAMILIVSAVLSLSLYERANTRDVIKRVLTRVGIGALLSAIGIAVLIISGIQAGVPMIDSASITHLLTGNIISENLKVAFVLCFLGFGMFIGIAPMNFGMDELFSKVAAPFTGFALSIMPLTGIVTLFRLRQIVDGSLQDGGIWTGRLFLVFGLLTIGLSVLLLLKEINYKKIFAGLVNMHVGIILTLSGFGIAGMIPALMHLVGLTVGTVALFAIAGVLHATYKTTKIGGVRNMGKLLPAMSVMFFLVMAGFMFVPVSSLFLSGMVGFGYGLQQFAAISILAAAAILMGSGAVCIRVFDMLRFREVDEVMVLLPAKARITSSMVVVCLATLAVFGWYVSTQVGVKHFVDLAQIISQL